MIASTHQRRDFLVVRRPPIPRKFVMTPYILTRLIEECARQQFVLRKIHKQVCIPRVICLYISLYYEI